MPHQFLLFNKRLTRFTKEVDPEWIPMDGMFDDLLGNEPDEENSAPPLDSGRGFEKYLKTSHVHELQRGVTINWLMQAFGMNRRQVLSRLANCPVLRAGQNGTKVFDFRIACQYLVDPKINVKKYIDNLDPKELPENLRSEYWSARIKEQKARLNAEGLWLTQDVQAAFAEVFKMVKETVTLWTDTVDESTGLTAEQVEIVDRLGRALLNDIDQTVQTYTKQGRTRSQIQEFDEVDDVS